MRSSTSLVEATAQERRVFERTGWRVRVVEFPPGPALERWRLVPIGQPESRVAGPTAAAAADQFLGKHAKGLLSAPPAIPERALPAPVPPGPKKAKKATIQRSVAAPAPPVEPEEEAESDIEGQVERMADLLAEADAGMSTSQLAGAMGLSTTTTKDVLMELVESGFVVRRGSKWALA